MSEDRLWQQLGEIPAFRALLRAVESRFYDHIDLPEPLLDLGCGDGHFARVTFDRTISAGIDPWWNPLRKSQRTGMYDVLVQGMGDRMPFPTHHFASCFSNSVLEHIPDLQPVLNETNRVLKPGGRFLITTPSHYFTEFLGGGALLESMGLDGAAGGYRRFFNRISRHAHTDPPEVWAERLARAGFAIERWQYYFSRDALRALEIGHAQGVPSALMHALTGWWIVAPWRSSLAPTEQWLRPYYEEPFPEKGAYMLFVARKVREVPPLNTRIQVTLPAPRSFTATEMVATRRMVAESTPEAVESDQEGTAEARAAARAPAYEVEITRPEPVPAPPEPIQPKDRRSRLRFAILAGTAFFAALLGQLSLNGSLTEPAGGLTWFGISVLGLGGALLDRTGRWPALPRPGDIPLTRWLLLPAFLLTLFAAAVDGIALPLLAWLSGGALALYALWPTATETAAEPPPAQESAPAEWRWPISLDSALLLVLFAAALLLRLLDLTGHPWMLNGLEANIGLDAVAVAEGRITSPFGTGWLSNTLLPLFIYRLPLAIWGPSVIALRLPAALVGAATVPALYWIGKRLWNRPVGLTAAALLLGSHYHLHYSRLGMTNVLEALGALLGLGLLALAFQENRRLLWLLAGLALGLNAYLYTPVHLLPVILPLLLVVQLLLNPTKLWERRRGLWHAALLAFIVAYPQIAFYNSAPQAFWDRANSLGIIQSGWLAREAVNSEVSLLSILASQVRDGLLSFHWTLDVSPAYQPGVPLLRFWPGLLAVLGAGLAVWRLRQVRYATLLLWWLVTMGVASGLLLQSPSSHRMVMALPAALLLAAVALVWFGRRTVTLLPQLRPYTLLILAGAALLFATLDATFYFTAYRQQAGFGDRNTEVAYEAARYLEGLDGEWTAYFVTPPLLYSDFPTVSFLATDYQKGRNLFDVEQSLAAAPPPPSERVTFIVIPERAGELETLASQYPNGQVRQFQGVYGSPLFYAFEAAGPPTADR